MYFDIGIEVYAQYLFVIVVQHARLCAGEWREIMAWAANFDDFLNMPVTDNGNWNMQTSGMHDAFISTDPGNVITETSCIADLYSGMPFVVCFKNFMRLFQFMIEVRVIISYH